MYIRVLLQKILGFDEWHLKSIEERKYAISIINRVNELILKDQFDSRGCVIELGCGLGDLISGIKFRNKIGYDIDSKAIWGARLIHPFNSCFKVGSFFNIVGKHVNCLIAVNFLHCIESVDVKNMFNHIAQNNSIDRIIVDSVETPPYKYSHDWRKLLEPFGYNVEYISKGYVGWEYSRRRVMYFKKKSLSTGTEIVKHLRYADKKTYWYGNDEDKISIRKLSEFYDALVIWVRILHQKMGIEEYLESKGIGKVLVYGKNELGSLLLNEFSGHGIEFKMTDSSDARSGMMTFEPDLIVVTSIAAYEEIETFLRDDIGYDGKMICIDDMLHEIAACGY